MGWRLQEYLCERCDVRTESLEDRDKTPKYVKCPECKGKAVAVISAVKYKTCWGSVQRGKSDPHPQNVLNTQGLGEGQKYSEWKKQRDAKRRAESLQRARNWVSR